MVGQAGDRRDGQDGDLGDQHHAEYLRRDRDVEVGQRRDRDDADGGVDLPRQIDGELRVHGLVGEGREDADQCRLHGHVRDHRHDPCGQARDLRPPAGDEGVKSTCGGDMAGQRDESDAEDGQHDGGDDETAWRAESVAEADGDRQVARHRRDRCRESDHHEHHADQADGIAFECHATRALGGVRGARRGGVVDGHGHLPFISVGGSVRRNWSKDKAHRPHRLSRDSTFTPQALTHWPF